MKRQGLIAAGLLGSATTACFLFQQPVDLGAAEDGRGSFREAFRASAEPETSSKTGVRLNYFDATWDRVLSDLAESHKLTLVMDRVPSGRFARRDRNSYDITNAVRILNSELEDQGYRLLVQNKFLVVLDLDQARTQYSRPRLRPEPAQPSGPSSSAIMSDRGAELRRDGTRVPLNNSTRQSTGQLFPQEEQSSAKHTSKSLKCHSSPGKPCQIQPSKPPSYLEQFWRWP